MIGKIFGLLTVVDRVANRRREGQAFVCQCVCGSRGEFPLHNLISGNTKSCGCLKRRASDLPFRGATRLKEYQIWKHMKWRCNDPTNKSYGDYGARGVTVCEQWQNSFACFLRDVGVRPSPGHTLDRIDNDGNYEPTNCRWATKKIQNNNTRVNRRDTHNGTTMTVTEWSELLGIEYQTLRYRIVAGWPIEKAFRKELFDTHGNPK